MRKSTWNTYQIYGFTYDVANDQQSAGGVHLHQIRKTKFGWQKRICQSNGRFRSYSQTSNLTDIIGESKYEEAKRLNSK